MEKAIEKMKAEYDRKIENCDKSIQQARTAIAICRKQDRNEDADFLRKDRAIEQAKRQAYIQKIILLIGFFIAIFLSCLHFQEGYLTNGFGLMFASFFAAWQVLMLDESATKT